MNHLETLVSEWLSYNGYFTRSGVRVGKRAKGGHEGELDVVAFHPTKDHFLHVDCSVDARTWDDREKIFRRKLEIGRRYAPELFDGIEVPSELDQVIVHGFAGNVDLHRNLGGGRYMISKELVAEIMSDVPKAFSSAAVPEYLPLIRTIQLCAYAGAVLPEPEVRLVSAGGN